METKIKILNAAKKEFIEKGFGNASMRHIAKEVGITATALYRHYENKEDIFDAIVCPAVRAWNSFCVTENTRQCDMARSSGLEEMWNDISQTRMIVDMVYADYDENKLLFFGSEGTKYADFLHELVTRVQDCTLRFMDELKDKGIKVNGVDEKEMHLLLSAQYSAMLEMLKHDYSYEDALHNADTVSMFFREGWRKYLGF